MPLESVSVLSIHCDNPNCPGSELDSEDRSGWFFIITEQFGVRSPMNNVFCSMQCISDFAGAVADGTIELPPPLPPPNPPLPLST